MLTRQTVTDLFSSFIKFEQDSFKGWITVAKLKRSTEKILLEHPNTKNPETFLALHWHNVWRLESAIDPNKPIVAQAREHLAAYLQEVCYWAVYKTLKKLGSPKYKLSDCFQIAIAQLDTVLKGFNSTLGSNLKNYADVCFRSLLVNALRTDYEADLCSDWALLREVTQKRLETSLAEAGLTKDKIAEYILSWSCFKTIFVPTKSKGVRQLTKPNSQTWESIAALYNTQRLNSAPCNGAKMESRLENCAKCLRAYLFPKVHSLNVAKPGQENNEFLDDLPSQGECLWTAMVEEEEIRHRQQQQIQLQTFLSETITGLNSELRQILFMYYKEGLTQSQIAEALLTKQYKISRNLTKARESMLKALAKWSQKQFNVTVNSGAIAQMNEVLEQWLESHCQPQGIKCG